MFATTGNTVKSNKLYLYTKLENSFIETTKLGMKICLRYPQNDSVKTKFPKEREINKKLIRTV